MKMGGGKARSDEPVLQKGHSLNPQPYFVENAGQVTTPDGRPAEDVAYKVTKGGVTLYFQRDRVSYVYPKREYKATPDKPMKDSVLKTTGLYRMDMVLKGANADVKLKGSNQREAFSRHFTQGGKALKADHFGKLVYEDIYQGIDLVYKFEDGKLKYAFVVGKDGNADDIRLKYQGAEGLRQKPEGGLAVRHPLGKLEEAEPVAFRSKARQSKVAANFTVKDSKTVGFKVKAQPTKPYVIDPFLKFATFFGGGKRDKIFDVEVNNGGNGEVIVGGITESTSFPNTTGIIQHQGDKDGFLGKFGSNGSLKWFTYYGAGNQSSDRLSGIDIYKNSQNNYKIFATGDADAPLPGTKKGSFGPIGSGASNHIFISKFDFSGNIEGYSEVGSSGDEVGGGVAVTDAGVFFCGTADGIDFGGNQVNSCGTSYGGTISGVMGEVSKDLTSLNKVRYIDGNSTDFLFEIEPLGPKTMAIKGITDGGGLPTQYADQPNYGGGTSDHFVGVIYDVCQINWLTYLGGSSQDGIYVEQFNNSLDVKDTDSLSRIHVTGGTKSQDFPTTADAYQGNYQGNTDIMYARYDAIGNRKYSTYIGSDNEERGYGLVAYGQRHYLIGGVAHGSNLVQKGKSNYSYTGGEDGYLIEFEQDAPTYASYYGGSDDERILNVGRDASRDAFYAGGFTTGSNFPATSGAHQTGFGGSGGSGGTRDGFLTCFTPNQTCKTAAHTSVDAMDPADQATLRGSYKISNKVTIKQGRHVTFKEADLVFAQCARVVVEGNAHLTIEESLLRSCNKFWQGIIVKPGGSIEVENSQIQDAQVGIRATTPAMFWVKSTRFEYNIHHMILSEQTQIPDQSSALYRIDENILGDLICKQPSDLQCSRNLPGWTDKCNMISAGVANSSPQRSQIPYIVENQFQGETTNLPNVQTSKGILLNKVNGVFTDGDIDIIERNLFGSGLEKSGISIQNSTEVGLVNNDFTLSSDQKGVKFVNSKIIMIDSNKMDPVGQQAYKAGIEGMNAANVGLTTQDASITYNEVSGAKTGIKLKNVKDGAINNNTLSGFDHGIEYYADQNHTNATVIRKNKITGGTPSNPSGHGIVVSPKEDPVDVGTLTNTSTHTLNLDIECNKLWYNELGIVGSGNLKDQGSSSAPAGNNFDDQTGNSLNSEWDILWQYPVNSGGGSAFDYYYHSFKPNSSFSPTSYQMNGATHSSEDFTPQVTGAQGCYATWKRRPTTSLDEGQTKSTETAVQVYPNPFDHQIRLEQQSSGNGLIRVTTVLGKKVYEGNISGKVTTISTEDWNSGMYVVKILSEDGKVVKSRKILKVE